VSEIANIEPDCEVSDCDSNRDVGSCSDTPSFSEADVWEPFGSGWRPLHGRIAQDGMSLEWHEFKVPRSFAWSESFHPQSLEICLNLTGVGRITGEGATVELAPRSMAFYCVGNDSLDAERVTGKQKHQFLTIELRADALGRLLGNPTDEMHPLIRNALNTGRFTSGVGQPLMLYREQDRWVKQLLDPPVPQAAQAIWIRGRVLEILAQCLFESPSDKPLFCDRQKNMARDRVERAIEILREDLVEPPTLEQLGRQVGCSHYYLSRTFSKETGLTIQQYLRRLRMERASELLKSGRFNVTEAALEVGYSSMSHFSQAFCHEMGVCPALYQRTTPGS
tara:strand:+ start:6799 stop:7806 length:1008 start_codon:yes stop_codon:yes gene_type:complete